MKKAIIFFITAILLCIAPANVKASQSTSKMDTLDAGGETKFGTDDISIVVEFGYNGKVKPEKNIRINAFIDNRGNDFSGKFRVNYPRRGEEGRIVSQKTFAAASGEKKKVQFAIPYNVDIDSFVQFALIDEKGKEVCKKGIALKNSSGFVDIMYIGALSDNMGTLNYISNEMAAGKKTGYNDDAGYFDEEGYLFELESADITSDAKMLDALDVIIIDDFDASKLSKGQIEALKSWVNDGGELILGSGANADKVLKAFSGHFLNGTIGKTLSINTNFGVSKKELISMLGEKLSNKKIPLDITKLQIKGSTPIVKDGNEKLLSLISYGKGNVLVSEFSFALEGEAAKLYGRFIVNTIKSNLSDVRKNDMGMRTSNAWNSYRGINYGYTSSYIDYETLMFNNTNLLPNLKLYGTLLIVYVLLAGPISYIVMKKKDKRHLLWGIIPVLSAGFSITIYLLGTSTRIQKPYVNYVSTIELPEKASGENKVNTVFSLTSASNKSYEAKLPSDSDIIPSHGNTSYYSTSDIDIESTNIFDYGIEYGADDTKLMMNSLSAFESVYFKMNNKSSSTGVVEINAVKKDNKMSGIVNNKMSYDLENCVLYHNGTVYYIGSLPAGKALDLAKIPNSDIYEGSKYSYDTSEQLGAALDANLYDSSTDINKKRQLAMISSFAGRNLDFDSWFYGFVADSAETGFTSALNFDKYGATGVYKAIKITEKVDGYDIIGSLQEYAYDYDSSQTDGNYLLGRINGNMSQNIKVKYKFPENFKLKKIIYNETTAGGGEYSIQNYGYADDAFIGEAKVLDKATGKYVTLLQSAKDAEIDDIEKYLEDDGSLVIYYDIAYNSSDVGSLTLPKVNLAGKYERR